jgi:glycosyltransferase involved in cell wall biosynthesis
VDRTESNLVALLADQPTDALAVAPDAPLRVALLSYRGATHCGGQGVYLRNLGRELVALGHAVTVFSGPPYPELEGGVELVEVPSLELYRDGGPFKNRAWAQIRSRIDVSEFWEMMSGRFPEPRTFSERAARLLRARARDFDIVHDNQSLGPALPPLFEVGLPVVATVHHPLTVDREMALSTTDDIRFRRAIERWYAFVEMQQDVVQGLPLVLTVSRTSRDDIVEQLGVQPDRLRVVPVGVDPERFRPCPEVARVPGRVLTTASADVPLKGLVHLIEAVAKVRTERPIELVVVGKSAELGPVAEAMDRFGVRDVVRFVSGISDDALVELYAESEIAVVPSLYEGFSLPAVEAMACGVALVATTGGAIPEVTGPDGGAARLVPPGDAGALALAMNELLGDGAARARLGAAGRRRAVEHFTWRSCAERTVEQYRALLDRSVRARPRH